jgi:hypothetical protein
MAAGVVEAEGDQVLHAAHLAERHRRGVQNGRPPLSGDPQSMAAELYYCAGATPRRIARRSMRPVRLV